LTTIKKDFVEPVQLTDPFSNTGVTTIVPAIGPVPVFVAVNEILPVPLAPKPIPVLLLVQVYVVVPPEFAVVKFLVPVLPLHTVRLAGWFTWPSGLTVMVKVWLVPVHDTLLFVKVGVTVIVATTEDVPAFVAVNDAIFPVPLAARPIDGVLFVHAYVVVPPVLLVEKFTAAIAEPVHNT